MTPHVLAVDVHLSITAERTAAADTTDELFTDLEYYFRWWAALPHGARVVEVSRIDGSDSCVTTPDPLVVARPPTALPVPVGASSFPA